MLSVSVTRRTGCWVLPCEKTRTMHQDRSLAAARHATQSGRASKVLISYLFLLWMQKEHPVGQRMIFEEVAEFVRVVESDKRFAILHREHRGGDFLGRNHGCLLAKHTDAWSSAHSRAWA